MSKLLDAARLAGGTSNNAAQSKIEWTKTHTVQHVIRDYQYGNVIGYELNTGEVLSSTELIQLLEDKSTGTIFIRDIENEYSISLVRNMDNTVSAVFRNSLEFLEREYPDLCKNGKITSIMLN